MIHPPRSHRHATRPWLSWLPCEGSGPQQQRLSMRGAVARAQPLDLAAVDVARGWTGYFSPDGWVTGLKSGETIGEHFFLEHGKTWENWGEILGTWMFAKMFEKGLVVVNPHWEREFSGVKTTNNWDRTWWRQQSNLEDVRNRNVWHDDQQQCRCLAWRPCQCWLRFRTSMQQSNRDMPNMFFWRGDHSKHNKQKLQLVLSEKKSGGQLAWVRFNPRQLDFSEGFKLGFPRCRKKRWLPDGKSPNETARHTWDYLGISIRNWGFSSRVTDFSQGFFIKWGIPQSSPFWLFQYEHGQIWMSWWYHDLAH